MGFNFGINTTLIVAIPFVVLIVVFLGVIVVSGRRAAAARSWPVTTGKILMSGAEAYRTRTGRSGYSTMYRPNVVYEYSVNGQRLMGNQINFGMSIGYGSPAVAERVSAKYPTGSIVQVYYNPSDPAQAVLEKTARSPVTRILLLIIVFIIVMLVFTTVLTGNISGFINQFMSSFR
jgi:hypothetical protein